MNDEETPAATETNKCRSTSTCAPHSFRTPGRMCGFTAKNTTSHRSRISALLLRTSTSSARHRAAVEGSEPWLTARSEKRAAPPATKPRAMASAIAPPPTNPMEARRAFGEGAFCVSASGEVEGSGASSSAEADAASARRAARLATRRLKGGEPRGAGRRGANALLQATCVMSSALTRMRRRLPCS